MTFLRIIIIESFSKYLKKKITSGKYFLWKKLAGLVMVQWEKWWNFSKTLVFTLNVTPLFQNCSVNIFGKDKLFNLKLAFFFSLVALCMWWKNELDIICSSGEKWKIYWKCHATFLGEKGHATLKMIFLEVKVIDSSEKCIKGKSTPGKYFLEKKQLGLF